MKRVVLLVGTRPEAIKLSPIAMAFRNTPNISCTIWSTGQHGALLDQALLAFQLRPSVDLRLMRRKQRLGTFLGRAIELLDKELEKRRPDMVLVQGDTGTALAGTLSSFNQRVPVGHVEAGLRTFDFASPWPEEANRTLISRLATLHFAPTETARDNLIREGVAKSAITITGNTVVDALQYVKGIRLNPELSVARFIFGETERPFILLTLHRREAYGRTLVGILKAIRDIAIENSDHDVVFPVHPNPQVRVAINSSGIDGVRNIYLVPPVGYLSFIALIERAKFILTDSGGVQEEAPSLGKVVLVLRDKTERPEAIKCGLMRLLGTNRAAIFSRVTSLLRSGPIELPPRNPYGDGRAALRIARQVSRYLRERHVR